MKATKSTILQTAVDPPGRSKATARYLFGGVLFLLAFVALGACNPFGGGDGPTPVSIRTPQPRTTTATPVPSPTATPDPTATPEPTATPTPNLGRRDVERLVWARISSCAEQLATGAIAEGAEGAQATGVAVEIQAVINPRYSPETDGWLVDASNTGPALTFGVWEVSDATGQVTPLDDVARSIVLPGVTCSVPSATLATALTPPIFILPAPTSRPGRWTT